MAAKGAICYRYHHHVMPSSISFSMLPHLGGNNIKLGKKNGIGGIRSIQSSLSSSSTASPWHEWWKPDRGAPVPSLSDVIWPSAGAFAAMAIMGRIDQMLAPKGLSMTIAPLGAVSAILFATPASPGARKYNMFVAHIGCAFIGVLALSIFGAGWLARSTALAASIAFMIYTRSMHPPAASLPILFIDGAKFHHLHLWYTFFPGATGCIILCLIIPMMTTNAARMTNEQVNNIKAQEASGELQITDIYAQQMLKVPKMQFDWLTINSNWRSLCVPTEVRTGAILDTWV